MSWKNTPEYREAKKEILAQIDAATKPLMARIDKLEREVAHLKNPQPEDDPRAAEAAKTVPPAAPSAQGGRELSQPG